MLRMYFVQHWFNLADAACEDALLDSPALRRFVGIDLGRERVPDATTLLKFRRLLDEHKLGQALFAKVGEVLQEQGMKVGTSMTSSGKCSRLITRRTVEFSSWMCKGTIAQLSPTSLLRQNLKNTGAPKPSGRPRRANRLGSQSRPA